MYPALCFVNLTSGVVPEEAKETLQNNLSPEEYEIISDTQNVAINFKFKLIEFFSKEKFITSKK